MSADDGWSDWTGQAVTQVQRDLLDRASGFLRRISVDLLVTAGRDGDAGRVAVDADGLEQDLHDELADERGAAGRDVVWAAQQLLLAAATLDRAAAGAEGIGVAEAAVLDVATALEVALDAGAAPARAVLARDYVNGRDPLGSLGRAADAAERLA